MGFGTDKRNTRSRLSAAFYNDLYEDWLKNGKQAIIRLRKDDPAGYARLVGSMVKNFHVEVTHVDEAMRAVRSREELFALLEERGGSRAVEGFQRFLDHLDAQQGDNIIELRPNRESGDDGQPDGAA